MQRDKALAEIKDYRQTVQGNAQSLFSALSIPLGLSPDAVRQGAFMALAVIVDICAIAALLALSGMEKKSVPIPVEIPTQPTITNETPAPTKLPPLLKQIATDLTQQELEVAEQIVAGKFGDPPPVRKIIDETPLRHPGVKRVMDYLVEKNQIKREGKQFRLVQTVIL